MANPYDINPYNVASSTPAPTPPSTSSGQAPPSAPAQPFDATPLGIGVNTVKNLALGLFPGMLPADENPYIQTTKDIFQGFARAVGSAGLSITRPFRENTIDGRDTLAASDVSQNPTFQTLWQGVFGTTPIPELATSVADMERSIKQSTFAQQSGLDKHALPLAFAGVLGGESLNFVPFGGTEEGAVRALARETDPATISVILGKMGIDPAVAAKAAEHLAQTSDPTEIKATLSTLEGVQATQGAAAPKRTPEEIQQIVTDLTKKSGGEITTADKLPAKTAPTVDKIPTELQPLAEEARKYGNADEFVNAQSLNEAESKKLQALFRFQEAAKRGDVIDAGKGIFKENGTTYSVEGESVKGLPLSVRDRLKYDDSVYPLSNVQIHATGLPENAANNPKLAAQLKDFYSSVTVSPPLPEVAQKAPFEEPARGEGSIKSPADAAAAYKATFIDEPNANGGLVEISGDEMKKLNGGDYAPERSSLYSKEAYNLVSDEIAHGPKKDIVLLGGGSGSIKSEGIGRQLKDNGFTGLLYDNSLSNYSGTKRLLDLAKAAGKNVEIRASLPDLEEARLFTLMRAEETGRPVTDADFARSHSGFVETLIKLLENGDIAPEQVHLFDLRGDTVQIPTDVLATLKGARYTEADILAKYGQETLQPKVKDFAPRSREFPEIRNGAQKEDQGVQKSLQRPQQEDRLVPEKRVSVGEGIQAEKPVEDGTPKVIRDQLPPSVGDVIANGKSYAAEQTPAHAMQEIAQGADGKSWQSLVRGYMYNFSKEKKAHIFDYLATPEFVLEKLGLGKGAEMLQDSKDAYRNTLKKEFATIADWQARVKGDPYAKQIIFQYLDGREKEMVREMSPEEHAVAREIRGYLQDWAYRLKLPEDNQLSRYITHIFERDLTGPTESQFVDPELSAIMSENVAKSVYDPFLQKRLGKPGYVEDVWRALDAYVKRAARKEAMDPALERIADMAKNLDTTTYNYVRDLSHRVNLRPTEIETAMDSFIKQIPWVSGRFTDRPLAFLSRKVRGIFYRGTLGLNFSSTLRNLSQGANTYAKLGEKYTVVGYSKLFTKMAARDLSELSDQNILMDELVQDRQMGVIRKNVQRMDNVLFGMFELAEKINRGAAYYGAKAQALNKGLSEEQAIKYAKRIVRETQFAFGAVDTPVWMNDDLVKTLTQLQTYNVKQAEFLKRMVAQKDFVGLMRWTGSSFAFVYTIGKLFGMTPAQLVPTIGLGGAPLTSTLSSVAGLSASDAQTKAKAVSQLQRNFFTLLPAGAQLRKTLQGAHDLERGADLTPAGHVRYPVNPDDALQALLFGPSSLPQAQDYFGSIGKKKTAPAGNPYNQ